MPVSIRSRHCTTERKGNKSSTYPFVFGFRQLACILATQHSIRIVHIITSFWQVPDYHFPVRPGTSSSISRWKMQASSRNGTPVRYQPLCLFLLNPVVSRQPDDILERATRRPLLLQPGTSWQCGLWLTGRWAIRPDLSSDVTVGTCRPRVQL